MRLHILQILFVFSLCLIGLSCSESSLPGTDIVEIYHLNISDSTLTADYHEFNLSFVGDETPPEWEFINICVAENIKDTDSNLDNYWELANNSIKPDGSIDMGWITLEKSKDKGSDIRVVVNKNDTNRQRSVRIVVGYKPFKDAERYYIGQVILTQKAKPDMSPFSISAKYKGKIYSTIATLNYNEELCVDNNDFKKLLETLASKQGVETIIYEDNLIHYYDSDDTEANAAIQKLYKPFPIDQLSSIDDVHELNSRSGNAWEYMNVNAAGYCALFDDKNFSDTHIYCNLFSFDDTYDQMYLRDAGLNDKISSIAVAYKGNNDEVCSVLTIWEDSYYNNGDNDRTKHRISIIATSSQRLVALSDLRTIPCINSSNTWNDRISSSSFHFGYLDSYLKDY